MTQPIETTMHLAVGLLRERGYDSTRVRIPATVARDYNPDTGMWDIVLPNGAGSFPGEDKIELLKDGEVAVTVTENMVRLWGDDHNSLSARLQDLMEIIG